MEEKEKKSKDVKKIKKSTFWKILSLVLVILLAVSIYTGGFKSVASGGSAVSKEAATEKAMDFINNMLLQPGMEASLENVEEVNGLYKLNISIAGQSFESFVTKDGAMLLPQGYAIVGMEDLVAEATSDIPKTEKPNVKMFVMAFCPYGQQAEAGLGPALELLGDTVEFEPHFVIYSDYASRLGADWEDFCLDEEEQYCSMHGIAELNEGVRQLCVFRDTPDKWWDYVNKINEECSVSDIEECWEGVAEEFGLDVDAIKECQETKAELLLKREVLLNDQFEVQGSPTVLINDASYSGSRSPEAFKSGICNAFEETPSICEESLDDSNGGVEGNC